MAPSEMSHPVHGLFFHYDEQFRELELEHSKMKNPKGFFTIKVICTEERAKLAC